MAPPGPYPDGADAKIRQAANIFGRDDIISLLDDVRTRLLGNAVAVQTMARAFAGNKTLGEASVDGIGAAADKVSGTWTGRAADQFNAYAGRVGNALNSQQSAVATMSSTLVQIAQEVIRTYNRAIVFIGKCSSELAKISIKGLLAAVTVEIPIVDLFTTKDVVDTVIDAFGTLVDEIMSLFAESVEALGNFQASATGLTQIDTNFVEMPKMPENSGMNNEKQWRVNPTAFPE
jgi:uncharacterized protein YukE